jgi:hypothetical protein
MKTLRTHLGGLRRMVNIRGGLDIVKSTNILTASIVFWYAINYTIACQVY